MLRKKSKGVLVIARQQFGFLRHGQPLSDSESTAGESSRERKGIWQQTRKTHQWIRQAHLAGLSRGYRENKHAYVAVFPSPWVGGNVPMAAVTLCLPFFSCPRCPIASPRA
jgi:hypothetical protein